MKKTLSIMLSIIICLALFAGCGNSSSSSAGTTTTIGTAQNNTTTAAGNTDTSLSGTLTLTGSTSMSKIAGLLTDGFKAKYSGITTVVGGNGSGEGPKAVDSGTAQFGMLSRNVKDDENPDNYDKYTIAMDGVAVIVNKDTGVSSLTSEQIGKIFTGETTNWKDLGGIDEKITVLGREAASGTRAAFEEILKIADKCVYAGEYNETGVVKEKVATTPGSIGYISLASVDESVVALTVDNVAPSEATVKDGSYPISRPFIMITSKDSADPIVHAFIEYMESEEGQALITKSGCVPVEIKAA